MQDTQAVASQQSGACAGTGARSTRPWQASNQVPQGGDAVVAASLEISVCCAALASDCMAHRCGERMCLRRGRAVEVAPPAVRRRGKHRTAGGTSGNHELIGRTILCVPFCMASALVPRTTEHGARLGTMLGSCEPRLLLGSQATLPTGTGTLGEGPPHRLPAGDKPAHNRLRHQHSRGELGGSQPLVCSLYFLLHFLFSTGFLQHWSDAKDTTRSTRLLLQPAG